MSILNQYLCADKGANTGTGDCPLKLTDIKKYFIVDLDFELTEADMLTEQTALEALISASQNDLPNERLYPTPSIEEVTDNTEDVVTEAIGGTNFVVRDGKYNLSNRFVVGARCALNALRKFNDSNKAILILDTAGVLAGWKVGTSLKGIPLNQFYANPARIATSSTIENYSFMVAFEATYFNEGIGWIKLNSADALSIKGLQNINLTLVAPRAANVFSLRVTTGCSAVDMYEQYGDDLATLSNWQVRRLGALVPITSITPDDTLNALTFTLNASSPNYDAAGPFVVYGTGVSFLVLSDVEGYEIMPKTIA